MIILVMRSRHAPRDGSSFTVAATLRVTDHHAERDDYLGENKLR